MGARLDQHFLVDSAVGDAILAAAEIGPDDRVVEIGPGRGALTEKILARGARLTAVELDRRLAERLAPRENFRLIQGDFLRLDLAELGEGPVKFVANLPYAVATPILQRILAWPHWMSAVLMFQKEVALRIVAGPGGPDYGLLTLSAQLKAEADLVVEAPPDCFQPRPKVASAVVRLVRRARPLAEGAAEAALFRAAKAAFGQRRKMAAGLVAAAFGVERARVEAALEACGLKPTARAQEIPLEGFLKLSGALDAGPESWQVIDR